MVIHCEINSKNRVQLVEGEKAYKIEFIYRGYWSEWIAAYNVKDAAERFKTRYPYKTYCRCKYH